nr:protein ROS1-like [Tanacetum cinerariifolium]
MKPTLIIEDIEDLCIPKVNPAVIETEELLTGVWNHMSENNMPLKKNAVSKAIVTVSAKKPSHRRQKSKVRSAGRLRTEHQVYELPDWHPLVQMLDKRDPDDKHQYLLATWPPVLAMGIWYNIISVRLMQVFADDDTSEKPLVVPRKLLLDLTVKTLYCGTSISTIFQAFSTQEVGDCFWEGYVCIRGFSMKTREPRLLQQQFHRTLPSADKKGKSPRQRIKKDGKIKNA